MFTFISLEHPIRSAIILYLIILAAIVIFRPKLIKNGNSVKNKYILPIVIIIISVVSYYIFAILGSI